MKKKRIRKCNEVAYSAICWIQDRNSGAGPGGEMRNKPGICFDLKKK
jgi:hypothetical protein